MSRNPVAGNAWKYNKTSVIRNKKKDKRVKPSQVKRELYIWSGGRVV